MSTARLKLQENTGKRLCHCAGLTPDNNGPTGKKRSVRILRAGVYLKPALVQVAHAAVKDKPDPYYALKYERIDQISDRYTKKSALLVKICYNVF